MVIELIFVVVLMLLLVSLLVGDYSYQLDIVIIVIVGCWLLIVDCWLLIVDY